MPEKAIAVISTLCLIGRRPLCEFLDFFAQALQWRRVGKLYLVTCDLLEDGDYGSLRERLRALDARQLLDRQWALRTTYTATELRNLLRGFLGDRDRIVVTEVGAEWSSRRALANLAELYRHRRTIREVTRMALRLQP